MKFTLDGSPVTLAEMLADNDADSHDEIREAFHRAGMVGSATIGGGAGAEFVLTCEGGA